MCTVMDSLLKSLFVPAVKHKTDHGVHPLITYVVLWKYRCILYN